jgi:hypothetical protein
MAAIPPEISPRKRTTTSKDKKKMKKTSNFNPMTLDKVIFIPNLDPWTLDPDYLREYGE